MAQLFPTGDDDMVHTAIVQSACCGTSRTMVNCGGGTINREKPKFSKAFQRPKGTSKRKKEKTRAVLKRATVEARGISKKKARLLTKRTGKATKMAVG